MGKKDNHNNFFFEETPEKKTTSAGRPSSGSQPRKKAAASQGNGRSSNAARPVTRGQAPVAPKGAEYMEAAKNPSPMRRKSSLYTQEVSKGKKIQSSQRQPSGTYGREKVSSQTSTRKSRPIGEVQSAAGQRRGQKAIRQKGDASQASQRQGTEKKVRSMPPRQETREEFYQEPVLKQSTEKKPKKPKRSRAKGALILVLLLVLVGGLGFLGFKFLRVEQINVRGNERIEDS